MRVLILGSKGFIGDHLFRYFKSHNHQVLGCDIHFPYADDSNDYIQVSVISKQFSIVLNDFNPEYCINAAGSGSVKYSVEDPKGDLELNVSLVASLLDNIRRYAPACKLIHISSAAVYGNPTMLPISESASCDPVSPYGFHKLMSEVLCKEYHTLYKMSIAIVRPFSIFGEGLRKQLLWDLCTQCLENKEIELFGSGSETRDFMHIKDLCHSMALIMSNSAFQLDIYNLGNGESVRICEIGHMVSEKYFGKRITFNNQVREADPKHMRSDINKIKSIGYCQTVSLSKGIDDYVNWFLSLVK